MRHPGTVLAFAAGFWSAMVVFGMVGLGAWSAGFRWVHEDPEATDDTCACSCDDVDEAETVVPERGAQAAAASTCDRADRADASAALRAAHDNILEGRFDDAVGCGRLALERDPALHEAHKTLGVAYSRAGRYCEAGAEYRTYLARVPDSPMADRIRQVLRVPEIKGCPSRAGARDPL